MDIIAMKELQQLITEQGQAIGILDVRGREAFASGHIEGAHNIPLDELAERISELQPDKPYYVVCYSGNFSIIATHFLTRNGFTAANVRGGMGGYDGPIVS